MCDWCRQPLGDERTGYVVDRPPLFQVFDVHAACFPALEQALIRLLAEWPSNPQARLQRPDPAV